MKTSNDLSPFVGGVEPGQLHIDIVGDWVCPFSYLGKRSLDRALSSYAGPIELTWHPFQLNPELPEEGIGFDAYLEERFGNRANVTPAIKRIEQLGREAGIHFDFDKVKTVPNTLDAHRVMSLARETGQQHALAGRLFRAFFEQGRNIGDRSTLVELGSEVGIGASAVRDALASDDSLKVVLSAENQIRGAGVSGTPAYVFNGRLLVPGAQPARALLEVIDQATFLDADSERPTLH